MVKKNFVFQKVMLLRSVSTVLKVFSHQALVLYLVDQTMKLLGPIHPPRYC